jgi:glycosyltransferase involved in cell wall biosynthesis
MGGVRRHNAQLFPRAAARLEAQGGSRALLVGRAPRPFAMPPAVELYATSVPAQPALARATLEGRALRRALTQATSSGRGIDLVHTGHLPVPRGLPCAYTLTVHDLRALELTHTPMSRRLMARKIIGLAVERAAGVICVSEHVRGQLLERFRLDPERVCVVPNAGDHFTVLPRAIDERAPLLHVGHLERRKNLELLLRALALDPTLPRLCLAGESKQGEAERLRALAVELGVAERVEFLGAFDEAQLAPLYARAACVVLPSHLEGFGIAALEAQRALVPLAVSRTSALLEVAGPDTPQFSPADPAECAAAIRAAMALAPSDLRDAAERSERFRWQASAELLVQAWIRAAKSARG